MEVEQDLMFPQETVFEGEKKIVVIGNNQCGKSSLIASFVSERPVGRAAIDPKEIRRDINFGRERVSVVLLEAGADPQHEFHRRLQYRGASAVLVCFAFDDPRSISTLLWWLDEVRRRCEEVEVFVVGCKLDQKHRTPVSAGDWGACIERNVVAYKYVECSARTGEGVSHLVRMVGRALLNQQQSENPSNDSTPQN